MERRILIRGARQLLTLHGPREPRRGAVMRKLGLIEDGAVLIIDGRVDNVGPSRRVENLAVARGAVEISADGQVVMPGFVDAHTHLVAGPALVEEYERRTGSAGGEEIEDGGGGLNRSVRAVRTWTRPRIEMEGRRMLRQFIRHGTTALEAKSGLGLDSKTEMKLLRALTALKNRPLDVLPTFSGASAFPPNFEGDADSYLQWLAAEMLPKIRRLKLARFADVRCGEDGFTAAQARRYLEAVTGMGFLPRVLTDEKASDGGVQVAVEADALSVDHLECISDADIEALARSETIGTLLPGAAFHQGTGRFPPARRLIDAGAAIALATGYSADRCPTCSMPAILSIACAHMGLTPAEAVSASTVNAAYALGLGERLGALERGKDADLIMLAVRDYREIPYHFGMNLVTMVMKRGDVLYPRMEFPWTSR